MPKGGGIPEKTSEFNEYLQRVIPMLVENVQRFYPYEKEINVLKEEWGMRNEDGSYPADSWNGLYALRINPLTRTSAVNKMLRAKRLSIDKQLRYIYLWAVNRMTAGEQLIIGRHPRVKKNKRIAVPNRAPLQHIKSQAHSVITLRLRDPEFISVRRKPAGCYYIRIECEIEVRKGKKEMFTETTGKTIFTLRLNDKFTGKKIRMRSCYCNRRGNGPWSSWLNAIVI